MCTYVEQGVPYVHSPRGSTLMDGIWIQVCVSPYKSRTIPPHVCFACGVDGLLDRAYVSPWQSPQTVKGTHFLVISIQQSKRLQSLFHRLGSWVAPGHALASEEVCRATHYHKHMVRVGR